MRVRGCSPRGTDMANPIQARRGDKTFHLEEDHHPEESTGLGFWLYLMSDCLIFAALFATYAVLGRNYAAGPAPADLFDLKLIAVATTILLVSSITYGVAMVRAENDEKGGTIFWLGVTGVLGLAFLGLEAYEFYHLIAEGAGPQRSAFLSSFFALVGTHGLHVTFGIIWLVVLMVQVSKLGLTPANQRRLMCLSMFWHFLDLIWIGVFSVVYLMGVVV